MTSNPLGEALGLVRTDASAAPDLQILFISLPYRAPTLPGPDNGYTIASVYAIAERAASLITA